MVERTEEVTEDETEGYEDPEAQAAMAEAQSVIDRVQSGDGTDGGATAGGTTATESPGTTADASEGAAEDSGGGLSIPRPSLPSPSLPSLPSLGNPFSGRLFVAALVVVTAGVALGNLVPLGPIGYALGVVGAAFLFGLVSPWRAYLEVGISGTVLGGIMAVFANVTVAAATGRGVPIFAVGAGAGLLAALFGLYLGRDLRAGLTQKVG